MKRRSFVYFFACAVAALLLSCSSDHRSATPAVPFTPSPNLTTIATNGTIAAIVTSPDGTTYIGGRFSLVGLNSGSGVPLDALSGTAPRPFPHVNGTIYTIVPDGSGGWFIGGYFSMVGDFTRNNIAHILSAVRSTRPGTPMPTWTSLPLP